LWECEDSAPAPRSRQASPSPADPATYSGRATSAAARS